MKHLKLNPAFINLFQFVSYNLKFWKSRLKKISLNKKWKKILFFASTLCIDNVSPQIKILFCIIIFKILLV